jgi:phage gpG-like protein
MAGIRFDLTQESLAQLQRLVDLFDDPAPALNVVGRTLTTRINLGFKTATSPMGDTWAPLVIRKGQPLRDTGHLQRSITYNVSGDAVEIGTNVQYAKIHQFGGWVRPVVAKSLRFYGAGGLPIFAKEVYIPARPFLPIKTDGSADLPPAWESAVLTALRKHYEGKL